MSGVNGLPIPAPARQVDLANVQCFVQDQNCYAAFRRRDHPIKPSVPMASSRRVEGSGVGVARKPWATPAAST